MTDLALLADPDIHEAFVGWLRRQRWFAGKDRPISGLTVAARVALPADDQGAAHGVEVLILHVAQDGDRATYNVPLIATDPTGLTRHDLIDPVDAVLDPDGVQAFVRLIAAGTGGPHGPLTASARGYLVDDMRVPDDTTAHPLGAEQSNTSIRIGDSTVLKVFRRLQPGRNPDIEVSAALTDVGCTSIAPLVGWVEGTWTDARPVTGSLAMLQTFLTGARDGWGLALDDLAANVLTDTGDSSFAAEARALGRATADVHAALARSLPTGHRQGADVAAHADYLRLRLENAVTLVPELALLAPALATAFDDLAAVTAPVALQRVHGDLHLGQVLRTADGWSLIDFEGEPATPLAERVALDHVSRDVAGMVRSFDYAARHLGIDVAVHGRPAAQSTQRLAAWSEACTDAFCRGYADVSGRDPRTDAVLLRAYAIDKAAYEAVYEAGNRPGWLPIPLAALSRLASPASEFRSGSTTTEPTER